MHKTVEFILTIFFNYLFENYPVFFVQNPFYTLVHMYGVEGLVIR